MNQQRVRRLPDEEWIRHMDDIKRLYLMEDKKLEGEGGLIRIMESEHNFLARYRIQRGFQLV
jgi:hypothetical protein